MKERIEIIRNWLKNFPVNPSVQQIEAVERAFMFLWDRQLADEQAAGHTNHENSVGFNKFDATGAKYAYEALMQYGHFNVNRACKMARTLAKYSRQLAEMPPRSEAVTA